MQSLSWYVSRLRSMGVAEILWRLRMAAAANADLVRIPFGLLPKPDLGSEMLDVGFRCMPSGLSRADHRNSGYSDSWSRSLFEQADRIMENRLDIFDLHDQYLGNPVDWHRDFAAGKSCPIRLSHLVDYRDFESVGDCKLVWEPNRHHQLVVLARAWQISRDTQYVQKIVSLIDEWNESNPFGYGMNWKSPLEIGIRLINWVWAFDLIRDDNEFNDKWSARFLNAIYLSCWEIDRKYSRGSSANNHLIGEAAGVFVASCYFRHLPGASERAHRAQTILEREILAQSFSDGCTREHAFGYQLFVIQFFTFCMIAGERAGMPFSKAYAERLEKMYKFMEDLCIDTASVPALGDSDDGYVLDLGDRPDRPLALLASASCLFDNYDRGPHMDSETAYWLCALRPTGVSKQVQSRPVHSSAYRESGYYVLRSSQQSSGLDASARILFDCAELGFGSIAAHGHADCLSFSLAIDGLDFLVDAGTYDYFSFPEWREYFRSTEAHNTIVVDDTSQSQSLGPFLWGHKAKPALLEWLEVDEFVRVVGEHHGYTRLTDPVTHRRSLTLNHDRATIDLLDTLVTSGEHRVRILFHIAPECAVDSDDATGGVIIRRNAVELQLNTLGCSLNVVRAGSRDCRGWVSRRYHQRDAGHVVEAETAICGTTEIETQLNIMRPKKTHRCT